MAHGFSLPREICRSSTPAPSGPVCESPRRAARRPCSATSRPCNRPSEVADSLAAGRKLAELRTQQEGLVESLRQGVDLADLGYRGGVASYLEYLDSERQLLDAQ